jgi:putative phosphonate transport system ATP-binding protein
MNHDGIDVRPMLQVHGLTRVYGGDAEAACLSLTGAEAGTNISPRSGAIVALNGVSFSVYEGEILGIMGESGSGKSTLLKLLQLEEPADAGSLHFWDRADDGTPDAQALDLFRLNPAEARRVRNERFGIVRQNPRQALRFDVSAGGNIAERILVSGNRNYQLMRRRAAELLQRTEIPPQRLDESPGRFSGGMQQRVQIAKALATRPRLLLLDEVTTGLDLSVQARIIDLILDLHQQYRLSVIVVTHDIGVVRTLASRTLIMKHGSVVEAGLTDQVLEDPQHAYTQELVSAAL